MPRQSKKETGSAEVRRSKRRASGLSWRFPPLPWILSAGGFPSGKSPKRILVGGALPEVLLLAKSLPDSEIVALDSNTKFVRALRLTAKRRRLPNLAALEATWDQAHLTEITGRNFDLILLPGLPLSASQLAPALENIAQCLARPFGVVWFRIPGESHPFRRSSEIFDSFGQSSPLADGTGVPSLILAASLAGDSIPESTPAEPIPFSLPDWISAFRSADLHFKASQHVPGILSRALTTGSLDSLFPKGAEELTTLLDCIARPVERHLLFSMASNQEPPWEDASRLAEWRPAVRFWPREKIPHQSEPYNRIFSVDLEIQRILPKLSLQLSAYMLELLRTSDGATPLRDLLARIPHPANIEELRSALWFFHHSCILRFLPPE